MTPRDRLPNTSPLIVLARIDRLDLPGDTLHISVYLDDGVVRRALAEVGEPWPPA